MAREEPNRQMPYMDTADPNREKPRSDIELLMVMKSSNAKEFPK
jgi:hypothetical protein